MDSELIPVRFPCKHGYHRSHFGEGGRLDNLRKRGAKWCSGGEFKWMREESILTLEDAERLWGTVWVEVDPPSV